MTPLNYGPIAVSVADAARTLGLGRTKIYELLDGGKLQSRMVGRRRLISMASIHAFMTQNATNGGTDA